MWITEGLIYSHLFDLALCHSSMNMEMRAVLRMADYFLHIFHWDARQLIGEALLVKINEASNNVRNLTDLHFYLSEVELYQSIKISAAWEGHTYTTAGVTVRVAVTKDIDVLFS